MFSLLLCMSNLFKDLLPFFCLIFLIVIIPFPLATPKILLFNVTGCYVKLYC